MRGEVSPARRPGGEERLHVVVLEEPIGPNGDWAARPLCEAADLENQSWHPEPEAEPNDPVRVDEACTVCAERYQSFDEGGLVL